jgi:MoaA/NifB/PqqE/SkfB family radical SAM enzyme
MGTPFTGEKMFLHADRLSEWQRGQLPIPVTVELNLTNLCNHACDGCTFSYIVNKDKSQMPYEVAERLIGEFNFLGVRGLTFSGGGEPLTYGPEKVLDLMSRFNGDVGLITNGSLLAADRRYAVCQWIRVSLDAYDEKTFQRFHGRGEKEFCKVIDRIRDFISAKIGPTVGIGFLTDRRSIEDNDIEKMIEFCADIPGLDYLQFRPLVRNWVDDPTGYKSILNEQYVEYIAETIRKWKRRVKFDILWASGKYQALTEPQFGRKYDSCLAHFLEATVGADCNVYICCHGQGREEMCLGNISKSNFFSVWNSYRAKEVYNYIKPSKHCPPACRMHMQNNTLHNLNNSVHRNFI